MRTRLERDMDRRALHAFAVGGCLTKRHHFCVRTAGLLRVATADDPSVGRDDDAADTRVGLAEADGKGSELQRLVNAPHLLLKVQRKRVLRLAIMSDPQRAGQNTRTC